jgi:iron-sulfur cluster repair protein YtfE (RIC family)
VQRIGRRTLIEAKESPMKIDPREMRQVAATQLPRMDMYAGIHKALRAMMADALLAVGRMDDDDELELAQATQRVVELLDFCASHLRHENEFVHAAIEARAPGASAAIAHEHEEHGRHILALREAVEELRASPRQQRPGRAQDLYRALALFVAGNFQHMHVEETAHNAVLWARYTDAELAAIHNALVASIPPAEMMFVLRWMVPFMNLAERTAVLADMKAHAPAPAFDAVLGTVRPHMDAGEWAKLARSLSLPV